MAKKTDKTESTVESGGYSFDIAVPVPVAATRTSDAVARLSVMPVGASFLESVPEPSEKITDPEERAKIWKETASRIKNRWVSTCGRFRRKMAEDGDTSWAFIVHVVDTPEHGRGVRVWRAEAGSPT